MMNIEKAAAALGVKVILPPVDLEVTKDWSCWDALYDWLVEAHHCDPLDLHNRTFVGAATLRRMNLREKERLRRHYKLRGEKLAKSVRMSDLGNGPQGLMDGKKITGFGLVVDPAVRP